MTSPRRHDTIVFSPHNEEQRKALQLVRNHDILFLLGPAGSGKTHCATAIAALAVQSKIADKVVLSRPVVPAEEELGYLPGDVSEKMAPWMAPFHDVFSRLSFGSAEDFFKRHVEVAPVAFLRGRTFSRCVAILDEAQNCTYSQLKLYLTRIGPRCKMIVTGDPDQVDIDNSGLVRVCKDLRDVPGIAVVKLPVTDSPRHPLIPQILRALR